MNQQTLGVPSSPTASHLSFTAEEPTSVRVRTSKGLVYYSLAQQCTNKKQTHNVDNSSISTICVAVCGTTTQEIVGHSVMVVAVVVLLLLLLWATKLLIAEISCAFGPCSTSFTVVGL